MGSNRRTRSVCAGALGGCKRPPAELTSKGGGVSAAASEGAPAVAARTCQLLDRQLTAVLLLEETQQLLPERVPQHSRLTFKATAMCCLAERAHI